ncbi:conjugal transfer protein TraD [Sphingobium cloacae]|uniref:Conjugual transfert protein, traC n=1 Tax=Sphingobium cloacae TaxID=120107 RepID=A0A1E1F1T8_9SPHN|nr:conjugal transfer protein TraD [Sphingobium cloacae]BAV64474.1 conjugual transfert protein, traC [Sphingobium cloacae]
MRKPRDYDAELKALEDKARQLKTRKVQQLGELIIATGADALTLDELAGALIVLAEMKDAAKREAWAKRGVSFFAGRPRASRGAGKREGNVGTESARSTAPSDANAGDALPLEGGAQSASGGAGAR